MQKEKVIKYNREVDKNYDYFKKNIENLIAEYNDKFIVIRDQKVIFNSLKIEDAFRYVKGKFKPGEYIIQKCEKPDESIQVFSSRVN